MSALSLLPACGQRGGDAREIWQTWGGPGRRNGDFVKPRGISANGGEVFVADTTGRIQVFSEEGVYRRQWSVPETENGTPTNIAFAADGRVLVPDTHYHRILIYTREGQLIEQWGEYGTEPGQFVYPTDIAEDPDGLLYISEYGMDAERVQVFDKDRKPVRQWGGFGEAPGQLNRAMAIARASDGNLFVVDTGNDRVQRFQPDGTLLGVLGGLGTEPGQIKAPFDVVVAPDGRLFVCEYGNNRVSCFDAAGQFIVCQGHPGRAPGQFNEPRGVAVSASGLLFVADTGNHRIQRINAAEFA